MNEFIDKYPKPQFNWYSKNDTYFEDLKKWKILKIKYEKKY